MKGVSMDPQEHLSGECDWYRNYSLIPSELECVLSYCDNPIDEPNNSGANYNFVWVNNLVNISHTLAYPCMEGMRVENDMDTKEEVSQSTGANILTPSCDLLFPNQGDTVQVNSSLFFIDKRSKSSS